MPKLPVFYFSCDRGAFSGSLSQPRLRRLIERDLTVGHVAFVTSTAGGNQPQIFHQLGKGHLAKQLQLLMLEQDFEVAVAGDGDPGLEVLAQSITGLEPIEVIELRLNTGMTSDSYRQIGRGLEALRNQGVLLICLDQKKSTEHHQPDDVDIRTLIQQWEQEQLWLKAMSGSSLARYQTDVGQDAPIADPTLCVLNTAFSLGGLKAPQRVFGFALNEDAQSLAGYGWMQ